MWSDKGPRTQLGYGSFLVYFCLADTAVEGTLLMPHGMGVPLSDPTRHPRLCTQCIINCQHVTEPMEQGREKWSPGGPKSLMSHPQCLRDRQGLRQAQGRRVASGRKGLRAGLNEACRETRTPGPGESLTQRGAWYKMPISFILLSVSRPEGGWDYKAHCVYGLI